MAASDLSAVKIARFTVVLVETEPVIMELGIPVMLIVESYPQAGTWVIVTQESIRAGVNTA